MLKNLRERVKVLLRLLCIMDCVEQVVTEMAKHVLKVSDFHKLLKRVLVKMALIRWSMKSNANLNYNTEYVLFNLEFQDVTIVIVIETKHNSSRICHGFHDKIAFICSVI